LSLDKLKIGTLINPNKSDFDTFIKGAILNVLNPKVLFFFMALLPQFLNSSPNKTNIQIIYMGLIFGLFGGIANVILSFLLKTTITKINDQSLVISIIYYSTLIISGLFILFGLSLIIMTANGS
jgi:threonine/homoserine/homoserine lactone efflux protein